MTRFCNAWAFLVPFAIAVISTSTRADVIDVSSDGTTTVHAQPAAYNQTQKELPGGAKTMARRRVAPVGLGQLISAAALEYGIDDGLLANVAWQESGYRNTAVSPKGAVGVMQLMPGTARALGVDRFDLTQNIFGGAAYLHQLLSRYDGNTALALAAYNAGPGTVDRFGGLPPFSETRNYVRNVLGTMVAPASQTVFVLEL